MVGLEFIPNLGLLSNGLKSVATISTVPSGTFWYLFIYLSAC